MMIKRGAVLHFPMSNYCHAIDEDDVVFRIRVAKDNLVECNLWYGDTACRNNPVDFKKLKMNKVAFDLYFDYYEIVCKSEFKRICYFFELKTETEEKFYYGDLFYDKIAEDRSEFYKLPYNRKEDIAVVPDWVKNAVVYNIFPDSFATSKRHISNIPTQKIFNNVEVNGKRGGTIKGILENLDYIMEMGFNCIYLNPIFTAGEYHKYDLVDYYSIDPCFGTNEDFKKLVEACHKNSIKVIIDGVFNHCGWYFFAFDDVVKNGEKSKYVDWFFNLTFPVIRPKDGLEYPNYECFAYERLMPKLNTSNPEVAQYFQDVGEFWVKEFDIDGWRLDVADEVNLEFWHRFRQKIKSFKQDVVLIGEVWQTAGYWLDGKSFDSTMNYDFRKHAKCFFCDNSISAKEFNARVTNMRMRYRKQMTPCQLNLLDSHDVPRFLTYCNKNLDKYKLALTFLMTFIGAPSVFYGDEQGFTGLLEDEYRQPMQFGECELKDFLKELISLRVSNKEFVDEDFGVILANERGLYIYQRGAFVVILNSSCVDEEIDEKYLKMRCVLGDEIENHVIKANKYVILKKE